MVVEAGVVSGHPADQPGSGVGPGVERGEDALLRVVPDQVCPLGPVAGELPRRADPRRPVRVSCSYARRPSTHAYPPDWYVPWRHRTNTTQNWSGLREMYVRPRWRRSTTSISWSATSTRSLAFYTELLRPAGLRAHGEIEGERGENVVYIDRRRLRGGQHPGEAVGRARRAALRPLRVGIHHICFSASNRATVDDRAAVAADERPQIESGPRSTATRRATTRCSSTTRTGSSWRSSPAARGRPGARACRSSRRRIEELRGRAPRTGSSARPRERTRIGCTALADGGRPPARSRCPVRPGVRRPRPAVAPRRTARKYASGQGMTSVSRARTGSPCLDPASTSSSARRA